MTTKQVLQLTEARRLLRSGDARAARQAADLSLDEVAKVCGVTPGAVSRWEQGQRRPTGRAALAYAHLLTKLSESVGAARQREVLAP